MENGFDAIMIRLCTHHQKGMCVVCVFHLASGILIDAFCGRVYNFWWMNFMDKNVCVFFFEAKNELQSNNNVRKLK